MIQQLLEQIFNQHITSIESVSGGDINNAYHVQVQDKQSYFVKHNSYLNGGEMLKAEAFGLQYLNTHSTFKIPKVINVCSVDEDHFLILDFIVSGKASHHDYFRFGQRLAEMHKASQNKCGFAKDNFIGKLSQKNDWSSNWKDFYINNRLRYQFDLAIKKRIFTSGILKHLEILDMHWDIHIPEEPSSLLHGDLWSGNYLVAENGEITIIDPAVYYGHREIDVAMTRVFGGFPKDFYTGYQDTFPLENGFEQRQALYQLYPILVHTNIFGGSYADQVIQILEAISRNWE